MQVCTIGINPAGAFGPGDDLKDPLSRGQHLHDRFYAMHFSPIPVLSYAL
ncbi:hypothetical protein [uncultured Thalassospira sp.]|jgi:hypothetical protein